MACRLKDPVSALLCVFFWVVWAKSSELRVGSPIYGVHFGEKSTAVKRNIPTECERFFYLHPASLYSKIEREVESSWVQGFHTSGLGGLACAKSLS